MRRGLLAVAALTAAGLLSTGCADGTDGPESVADRFQQAVADGDGEAACALLAPPTADELEQSSGQPCAEAVLEEAQDGGAKVDAERYGTMAQVRYRGDVVFLTRGDEGWQVMAAACRPSPSAPYDCMISGG